MKMACFFLLTVISPSLLRKAITRRLSGRSPTRKTGPFPAPPCKSPLRGHEQSGK